MDAYDRCTNLEKNLADSVAIYGRGRELFSDHRSRRIKYSFII